MTVESLAASDHPLTCVPPAEPWRTRVLVVLAYAALGMIFTWPLVLHWTTGVIQGYSYPVDAGQNLWNLWWTRHALLSGQNPFWTNYLFYPLQIDLFWQTLGLPNALMVLPILLVFGPIVAFNVIELLSFCLSGYVVYRIVRGLSIDGFAAFAAGFIYAFAPHHMQPILSASLEIVAIQWIPIFIYALIRALNRPSLGRVLLASVALAVATLSSHYYGLFCAVYTLLHVGLTILTSPGWRRRRDLLLVGAGTGVLWVGLLLPFVWPLDNLRSNVLHDWYDRQIFHSAELVDFVAPNVLHPLWGDASRSWLQATHPFGPETGASAGLVVYALMIYGVIRYRRTAWPWLALTLALAVLALGPEFTIGGQTTGVSLPFKWFDLLGPFRNSSRPSRIIAVMMVPLSITAAFGVHALRAQISRRSARQLISVLLSLALLGEFVVQPWQIMSLQVDPVYAALNDDATPGTVLELPPRGDDGRYMLNQLCHGRALVGGYLARIPLFSFAGDISTLNQLWRTTLAPQDIVRYDLAAELATLGIGFVTLHLPELSADQLAQMRQLLDTPDVTRYRASEQIETYRIDPEAARPVLLPDTGWYPPETNSLRVWRWIGDAAETRLITQANTAATISFNAQSYQMPRALDVLLNGALIGTFDVPTSERSLRFSLFVPAGDHVLTLRSTPTQSADNRSLSVNISQMQLSSTSAATSVTPTSAPPAIRRMAGAPCQ